MIPHYVLFLHGMGDEKKGFSKVLRANIQREFAATLETLREEIPGLVPAGGGTDCVSLNEVWWSDVTQKDQDRLWRRLFPKLREKRIGWTEFATDPRAALRRIRYWAFFRQFVLNYFGDPISYVPGGHQYKRIHDRIDERLDDLRREMLRNQAAEELPALVTVVAHSLGSVIASDLIYDKLNGLNGRRWPREVVLANFFSLGSPLAVYMLRYDMEQPIFASPITMQDKPYGLWINVYDPQDVLGFPLKQLNGRRGPYDDAVFADVEINAGQWWNPRHWLSWTPFSHLFYWEDRLVAEMIGRKAALDWVRVNYPKSEPELKRHYDAYKRDFAQRA
jgi:hypothetical protein